MSLFQVYYIFARSCSGGVSDCLVSRLQASCQWKCWLYSER